MVRLLRLYYLMTSKDTDKTQQRLAAELEQFQKFPDVLGMDCSAAVLWKDLGKCGRENPKL